jgi:hypothetical protein
MMDLSKILAISGKPGLYMMLSQTKSGFIVESLADGKRFPVYAHERVSSLEEISIFTTGEEDLPLKQVFKKFFDKLEGKQAIDALVSNEAIKAFFETAFPEHDPERVYVSDMKKAITWYNLLVQKEMLDFTEEVASDTEPGESETKAGDGEAAEDK